MATVGLLLATTLISTGATVIAQQSAKDAADAQSQSQQDALERSNENNRQALIENSRRQRRNKQRQLAQVRASQSASGFNTQGGTQLAIFGDIESRLDEQLNEQTSQALDVIGNRNSQISNLQFADGVRQSSFNTNLLSTGIQAGTSFGSGLRNNFNRTGDNPFGIF